MPACVSSGRILTAVRRKPKAKLDRQILRILRLCEQVRVVMRKPNSPLRISVFPHSQAVTGRVNGNVTLYDG
jgi:hypothetical protein